MRQIQWIPIIAFTCISILGCGNSGDTVINTTPMTPEEIAKMVADDQAVEDAESKGAMVKARSKSKK